MSSHGVFVKTERPMELDDDSTATSRTSSSGLSHNNNNSVEERISAQVQERMEQMQQTVKRQMEEQMKEQMKKMMQDMMSGNNNNNGTGAGTGGSSYPCPNFGQVPFKRESSDNNNDGGVRGNVKIDVDALDKDKLWEMFVAGKVTLHEGGKGSKSSSSSRDVKPDLRRKSSAVVDSDVEIESEEEEEEDPTRQGFAKDEWDLVIDDGKIEAILCVLCSNSGIEPRPITSDTVDKMKSLGEQHRHYKHKLPPRGYPNQVGARPIQCRVCKKFFWVEKLLEVHAKSCVVQPKKEPTSAAANGLVDCKVELSRSRQAEEVAKKRKLSAGSGSESADKRRFKARTKVEPIATNDDDDHHHSPMPPSPPPSTISSKSSASSSTSKTPTSNASSEKSAAAKKKTAGEEKNKTGSNKGDSNGGIKAYFSSTNKEKSVTNGKKNGGDACSSPANDDDNDDDVPNHDDDANDADDEGYDDNDKEVNPLPTDLVTLGDRWHEGEKQEGGFACPLCKTRPLSRPIFIEDHVAASHFKQKRYVCTICRDKHDKEENEDEKKKIQYAWSHKSTLNEHLQKNHSLQYARQEKLNFKLMEVQPLLPDAVNTMRLFFKLYPKKGEKTKPKYAPKKPNTSDSNQKKSKCPECDQKFYTQEERTLIDHIMWRHRDAPRYHCAHCNDDTGFGMVAGFEDHCKKEHGCDKNDHVSLLLMKVDKVPEELAKQYYIDDNDYQELHKGREIISDDEEDMPEHKEEVATKVDDMKIGFRRKEMFFMCRFDECEWTLSSRELFLVDKINKHIKTHKAE